MKSIDRLLGEFVANLRSAETPPDDPSGASPFPPYLARQSAQEALAVQIGRVPQLDPLGVAALVKGAMADPDWSVRRLCILALFHGESEARETVLAAAAFDPDPHVRRLSVEGLFLMESKHAQRIASSLSQDPDAEVADLARSVVKGEPIEIFEVESPKDLGLID